MKHILLYSLAFFITTTVAKDYKNISITPDTLFSELIYGTTDSSQIFTIKNQSKEKLFWCIAQTNPSISAGQHHNLALSSDGNVQSWGITDGWKYYGQSDIPEFLSDAIDVSAGDYHSLALLSDGSVHAWGDNSQGQIRIPRLEKNIIAVSAGEYHNLALHADGTVTAWGSNQFGQCNVPKDLHSVIKISSGYYHSLVLHDDGTVTAWGSNDYGQLNLPEGLDSVIAISAGVSHSLALHENGSVSAWGENGYGQSTVPSDLDSTVIAVSAGGDHSIALMESGTVRSWGVTTGWTFYGQTQVPSDLSDVIAIDAGKSHNLALHSNGSVSAWGKNDEGQSKVPNDLFLGISIPDNIIPLPLPEWLVFSEEKGSIAPLESSNISMMFDGKNKGVNTFVTKVTILTTDKFSPILQIPVVMNVLDIPFNSPPVLTKIGPQFTNEDESLTVTLNAFDAESKFVDFFVNSLSENILVAINENILIIDPIYNFFGDAQLTVTVGDGDLIDTETITLTVYPVNDPPTIENLSLSPALPKTSDDIQLSYTYTDPDNDDEGPSIIQWFKNDEIQRDLEGKLSVSAELTDCDDSWVVLVNVHDGIVSGTMAASNLVNISCPQPDEDTKLVIVQPEVPTPPIIPTVIPDISAATEILPQIPSFLENTLFSSVTLNFNLLQNNNLAYGHSLEGKDAAKMSYSFGADYRISENWVTGGHIKKYGNLNYGNPIFSLDTSTVVDGESAVLMEMFINKEQPLQYTRLYVGPRLSLVRWSTNETNSSTGKTIKSSKLIVNSGIDFGLIIKLFSGLSLKTNLYLGNVYSGHDYIKPSSNIMNTFSGNITSQLQYEMNSNLVISGGFYNEGAPSFKGFNINASYSFSPRNDLFYTPPIEIPPATPIILPQEPQIAVNEEDNSKEETKPKEEETIETVSRDTQEPSGLEIEIPIEKIPVDVFPVEKEEIVEIEVTIPEPVAPVPPEVIESQYNDEPEEMTDSELLEDDIVPGEKVAEILSDQFGVELQQIETFEMTEGDIKSVEDIIATPDGNYFIFEKKSPLAQDFRQKFSEAVKQGKPYFYWKNRRYSTAIK
ncbi:MAG: hypothetical protein CMG69_05475 [Candidatus Marinimicrobia bacterium]|nr:hypothetical protein [Candidatus Neomarinimicrobiota bacterium]|tara:strand:+ start:19620 stop:22835 length:3216 start_codon:yes stop_codon:yes gene_type:complete